MIGQLGLGGTEKQVVLLAQGLAGRGIDISVLVMFEGGPHESALRGRWRSRYPSGLRPLWAARDVLRNTAAFGGLVRRLRRQRPDVLHAFLLHSYLMAAPAARMAGIPVLVAGRRSLGVFKEDRRFLLTVERFATRATDLLIANARAVAEDTEQREGVPSQKVAVVYNGLPDVAFAASRPHASRPRFRWCSASPISRPTRATGTCSTRWRGCRQRARRAPWCWPVREISGPPWSTRPPASPSTCGYWEPAPTSGTCWPAPTSLFFPHFMKG